MCIRDRDKPDAFETEALTLFNEQKDTQEFFRIVSDDPVSYTHLDVYKRQS